jgi:hypothetical protein
MDTTNSTSEYLLLFRGSGWDRSLSPAELQKTMAAFVGWSERLSANGTMKAGQPLLEDARIVSGRNGRIVADGPFAESKEAIGGYFIVNADSFEDALEIAQGCPTLEYGTVVEVRPIAASCPTFQRVQRTIDEALQPAGA